MKSSLNSIFRTIWSEALGAWIAVSEITKTKGKRTSSSLIRSIRPVGAELDAASDIGGRLKPIIFAVACCFAINAQANPIGGQVVNGQASFNNVGNTLTVTNTPGTIINWQGFSINSNEVTHFAQQSASSAVLNRVVTNNPSAILGTLSSNGQVFLVNPSGIFFGAGSTVDVAGLVATSLNLSNADFLAGRHNYTAVAGAQNVSNAGNITAQQSGQIYLIAPNVENTGIINAPNGEILLVAGHSVELVNDLDPNLRVKITAPAGDATNIGQLVASSGALGLFGTVVRNSGIASADSATMQGGKIVFRSSQRTEVSGTASAQGVGGGTIEVLGSNEVQISSGATLDASGINGGGTILVGGDKQGLNPEVVNAKTTYVDATASIQADALQSGDGGKVIIWGDEATRAHGSISAQGGATGGDGGFVETSAHYLDVAGISVDASAKHGKAGEWLLDPADVHISATQFGGVFAGGTWTPNTALSYISSGTIEAALNGGTSVTVQTAGVTGGNGDIFVDAPIVKIAGGTASLTLLADRDINFAANTGISSTTGALNVVLRSDADANGTGTVSFAGTNAFSLFGGRVDIYYNPVTYTDAATKSDSLGNPYSGVFTATPYAAWMLVNNATNLQDMSTNLAGNYALGTNIDATVTATWNLGAGFIPIGDALSHFTGNVDGMGRIINGLTIYRPTTDYVGLFGYIGSGTNIKNVTLTNVSITGQQYVGGLVGTSYFSTLDGVTIGGTVSGLNYVGGLLGDSIYLGTVSNSNSSVNVTATGTSHVGGLVGRSQIYSTIIGSTASGSVTANSAERVGGLVGYSGFNSTVDTSSSSGIVSGSGSVGGLVGRNAGAITSSSATSTVSATTVSGYTSAVGGLVGYNVWAGYNGSGVAECSISCSSYIYGNISASFATGNVTGISSVGGLVGDNNSGASIGGNSYASGTVNGNYYVGGLTGYNNGNITNTYATGSVTGSGGASNNLGGLVGYNGGTIDASYASGVTVSGNFYVGGLVGFNQFNISNSYVSTGNVIGNTTVGGLVGFNNSSITNSYVNGGSVSATRQIGGLTGSGTGTLINSHYNIDTVQLNGGPMVTRGGIYNTQYATWVAGGYVALDIANYSASLPFNVTAYQVGTVQSLRDMLAFADNPAYSFLLTAGIDLSVAPGLYIPYLAATSFDGGGFTISNLNVDVPNKGVGLFGITTAGTTVTNLGVQDATVKGSAAVGAIIGDNYGALSNSHATRSVAGLVRGNSSVGGLVGNNGFGATITNSYVDSGAVVASVRNVGGLIGLESGTHTNSYFNVDSVTTNGGNNVTMAGLYTTQYIDWFDGGLMTPLVIANYASLVLQGDGSYGINSQQGMKDMLGFAEDPANYEFSLTDNNIDLTGMQGYYVPKLSGSFNGNNFTISNLSLNLPNYELGLFGKTASNSMVRNLRLVNASVTGYAHIGTLVGINFGNIDNVSVTGSSSVTATDAFAGGLVGQNQGSSTSFGAVSGLISNSYIDGGTVSASSWVGGLVGNNNHGYIDGSHAINTAVSGTSIVGGLVGNNQGASSSYSGSGSSLSGSISNSFVTSGLVTSNGGVNDGNIGGLVGRNIDGNIDLAKVLNTTVDGGGANSVGGLVGRNQGGVNYVYQGPSTPSSPVYSGLISNSYVSGGSVSSTANDVGGLIGHNFLGTIEQSHVDTAIVSGMSNVGGLVGYDGGEGWGGGLGLIGNSYALNTQVTGASNVGGLVGIVVAPATYNGGDNFDAVINSYVSGGTITGGVVAGSGTGLVGPMSGIGGLIGYNDGGNVTSSYVASGTVVSGGAASGVGGLIGINFGSSTMPTHGIISGSFVNGGAVSGNSGVGGLVGSNSGTIEFSYVAGAFIDAYSSAGGLVGYNNGSILQSYTASGLVSGTNNVGGLIGYNDVSAAVNNSFWDIDTTGQGLGAGFGQDWGYINTTGVSGLTTVERMTMSSFTGWSIANTGGAGMTWRIYEGHTGPLLTSFLTQAIVTANDATITYDGTNYSGGNGTTTSTLAVHGGSIAGSFGGTSQGARNAGSYVIDANGLYSDQLGYDITGYTNGVLTIDQRVLTGATIGAVNTTYGTATGAGAVSFGNVIAGDTVGSTASVVSSAANLSGSGNLNVGSYDQIASGLTGADAGNYSFSGVTTTANYTVNQLALTGAAISAVTTTYGTAAGAGSVSFGNVIAGDTVGSTASIVSSAGDLSGSGKLNAGSYDQTASGITGADAGNYSFVGTTTTANYTVNKANISAVNGISANNKTYDGNTSASLVTTGSTFVGMVSGDDLIVANANGNFADRNVGIGKTVSISGITLGGGDAANYNLVDSTASTTGDITQLASVTWSGAGQSNLWSDANNWAGGALPDAMNVAAVVIPVSSVVLYDSSVTSATLDSMVNNGSLTVADGSTLTVSSLSNTSNFTLNVQGTMITGTTNNTGTINIAGGMAPTLNATVGLNNLGTINLGDPISAGGASSLNVAGTLNNTNVINSVGGIGTRTITAGALINKGVISVIYPMTIDGQLYAAGSVLNSAPTNPVVDSITNMVTNVVPDSSSPIVLASNDTEEKKKAEDAPPVDEVVSGNEGTQTNQPLPMCQ